MTSKISGLLALCMTALMLFAACAPGGEDENPEMQTIDPYEKGGKSEKDGSDAVQLMIYDGEWTVNKQVVDTARLEVSDRLKLRLPEGYLGVCCFEKEYLSSSNPKIIEYKGHPAAILLKNTGYTDAANYYTFRSTAEIYGGVLLFSQASFIVDIDGVEHLVSLLSREPGNVIFRYDNGLWTIGLTINAFSIMNLETSEVEMRTPRTVISLYYNAKERIR